MSIAAGEAHSRSGSRPADKQTRAVSLAVLGIFCLALVLRVAAVFYLRSYVHPVDWENGAIARSIANGLGFSFDYSEGYISTYYQRLPHPIASSFQAPFYPYLLAPFYRLAPLIGGNASFLLLHLLQSVAGAGTVLTLFAMGRLLFGTRVAALAATIYAVYPTSVFIVTISHQTVWVVWFVAVVLLTFLRLLGTPTPRAALAFGAACGLAILTEPVIVAWLLPAVVWAWLRSRNHSTGRQLVLGLAVAILLLLPWQVRNQLVHHRFIFVKSSGPFVLWQGNNGNATGTIYRDWQYHKFPAARELLTRLASVPAEADRDQIWLAEVRRQVREHPGHALALVGLKLVYYWTYAPYSNAWSRSPIYWLPYVGLLLLAIRGIAASRGGSPYQPALYILFASFSAVYAVAYTGPRYRIPVEPILMVYAAYALVELRAASSAKRSARAQRRPVAPVDLRPAGSPAGANQLPRSADELYLSVVIPAFNEAARLGPTLDCIDAYLGRQSFAAEIVVVDDGSTDDTVPVAEQRARSMTTPLRVLGYQQNRGKGYAVRHGMAHARGLFVFFSDADLSTPVGELPKLLNCLEGGSDVAIASRALPGSVLEVRQPLHREMLGRCFNLVVRLLAVPGIRDTQCGFKGFTRSAAHTLCHLQTFDGFAFDVELLFLARHLGLRIAEVPVRWLNSPHTKVHALSDGLAMLGSLARLRLNKAIGLYPADPHARRHHLGV